MPPQRLTNDTGFGATAADGREGSSGDGPAGGAERTLTTAQVTEQLQLSVALVRKAIRDGRLQASLPAGRKNGYRIAPSAVAHWLVQSRAGPGGLS
jgi:excisionase family DNA binding protein